VGNRIRDLPRGRGVGWEPAEEEELDEDEPMWPAGGDPFEGGVDPFERVED